MSEQDDLTVPVLVSTMLLQTGLGKNTSLCYYKYTLAPRLLAINIPCP